MKYKKKKKRMKYKKMKRIGEEKNRKTLRTR